MYVLRMRKTLSFITAFVLVSSLSVGCAIDADDAEYDKVQVGEQQEIIDNLLLAGFPESEIEVFEDGMVFVGGDAHVTLEASREMIDGEWDGVLKQYRTSNLVQSPQTISVIGYTGSGYALSSKMQTGLSWAIDNYNALNIGLTFTLTFAASTSADIVVYNGGGSDAGGSAGFPSGGNPYKWVQLLGGLSSYSNNVNEHVIGHEIGHAIGFRHSDYFDRSLSCGSGGNEGSSGVGAIHIPGTPNGWDSSSLMNACFNSSEDGEFGPNDITALNYMY